MEIIVGRKGNQKLPIRDNTVSREHCRIRDNGNGTYTIENLSQSGTFVDGVEIVRSIIKPSTTIRLGATFSTTLYDLIGTYKEPEIKSDQAQERVNIVRISHLKQVWDNYIQSSKEIQDRQRRINLVRSGCGIFTLCAMPCIYLIGSTLGYILTGLGIIGNIYSFVGLKNDNSVEQRQKVHDRFEDEYICPNCRKSLPEMSYRKLIRNYQSCPYCKCKYVE